MNQITSRTDAAAVAEGEGKGTVRINIDTERVEVASAASFSVLAEHAVIPIGRAEAWGEFGSRWGDPGAALVMWIARQCTGLTLSEIGAAVGARDYAAVGMAIRRVQTRLRKEPWLKKQAAKACQLLDVKMLPQ